MDGVPAQLSLLGNTVIAAAYAAITVAITVPVVRAGQLRTNRLATATALIFFSCAVGHAFHTLASWQAVLAADQGVSAHSVHDDWAWPSALWDVFTAGVGVYYWTLRRGYGVLLGKGAPHYSDFLSAYIISIMAGLLYGVPGGAGVFETAMLQLLPQVDRISLTAAFLGFRVFYYFMPLAVALILLAFMKHVHDPDTVPGPVEP